MNRDLQRQIGALAMRVKNLVEAYESTHPATVHAHSDLMEHLALVDATIFRDYPAKERRRMAKAGQAMPDGCLSADTMIETSDGPRAIGASVGRQTLLTDRGWRVGTVRCFGKRQLFEVTFWRLGVTKSFLATLGHRWYLGDGSVVTTEILKDRIEANRLRPAKQGIATEAEQTADLSGRMAVVDMERGPFSAGVVATSSLRDFQAEGATSTLLLDHPLEALVGDSVFTSENSVASRHPAGRPDFYGLSTHPGAVADARLAVSAPPLVPHVELGVGLLDSTGTARNESDVLDWDSTGVFGFGHETNAIQSWEAVSVVPTDLEEQVYCAIVPGLHRFVLSGGLLTGNSFPIGSCSDAENAIHAVGRAKDVAKTKAFIKRRVRALGCTGSIFENWK